MMSNQLHLINNTSSDHCSQTPRGSEESKGLHDAVQSFQSAHFTHHSVDLWLFTESKGGHGADSPVNHKHHLTQPALWIPTDSSLLPSAITAVKASRQLGALPPSTCLLLLLDFCFIRSLFPPSVRRPVRSLDEPTELQDQLAALSSLRFQFALTLTSLVSIPRHPPCVGVPC